MLDIYLKDNQTNYIKKIELPLLEYELDEEIDNLYKEGNNDSPSYVDIQINTYYWNEEMGDIFNITGNDDIHYINEVLTQLLEHTNPHKYEILKFLLEYEFDNIREAIEHIDEVIFYKHTSIETIAKEYIENNYNLNDYPSMIRNNIDYGEVGKKLISEHSYTVDGPNVFHYSK